MSQKRKVILIYPKNYQSVKVVQLPLALLFIGRSLETAGYEPLVIDTRVDDDFIEKLKNNLSEAILIGISTMTSPQIRYALDIAGKVREISSEVPIVWGGIHPTLMAEQTIRNPLVDYVVRGEGEETLTELCGALTSGGNVTGIKGLTYKKDDEIYHNEDRPYLNFDIQPMPAYHLVDMTKYSIIGVQTARGCPHRCTYCFNLAYNMRAWRPKSANKILDEIGYLYNTYGVRNIHLVDDNFFVKKKRVKDFCRGLLENKFDIEWSSDCRVDYFEKYEIEFLELVKKSGCHYIQVAAESGSQRILDFVKKDITVEHIVGAIKKCKRAGLIPKIAFMIGIPTETRGDRKKTFDLMDKLKKIYDEATPTGLNIFSPLPNTPLTEIAVGKGFKEPQSLAQWGKFNYNNCNLPWFNKREQFEIESISYIPRFVFWYKTLEKNHITPRLKPFYYVYRIICVIRWKSRFFKFPVEYFFLEKFLEKSRPKN